MNALFSLIAVLVLMLLAVVGAQAGGMRELFSVAVPYAAITAFLFGMVLRIIRWAGC